MPRSTFKRLRHHVLTKAIREDAADACAMMASSNARGTFDATTFPAAYFDDAIDSHIPAAYLARDALWSVENYASSGRDSWAEAEAKLRCGWRP
jgi:hypothetical protein